MLLVLLLPGAAHALDLRQRPFSTRSWDRSESLQGLAQGPDGMLWIASKAGLSRFDGDRFVEVDLGDDGERPWLRRVLAPGDGSVWVATGAGTLGFSADGRLLAQHDQRGAALLRLWPYRTGGEAQRLRRFSDDDGLPDPWVWAMVEQPGVGIWVGTENGLALLTGGHFRSYSDGLPSTLVTALALAPDGALLVGTAAGVVVRRKDRFLPTPITQPVVSVAQDRAGRLWACIRDQLLRVDPDGTRKSFPTDGTPAAVVVDPEDNVWAGDAVVFAGGERVDPPSLSPSGRNSLLVDREGSIWGTTREGKVSQIRAPWVRSFGPPEGLPGQVVFSVLAARDGSMYVATQGGLARYADHTFKLWPTGDDVGWGWRNLAEGFPGTPNAGIWVASSRLSRGGPGGFHMVLNTDPPLAEIDFPSVVATRDGDLWLAQSDTGLLRFSRTDLSAPTLRLRPQDGLCSAGLTHGIETADGSLWFVSEYGSQPIGATRVRNGKARCYGPADGLPAAQIGAVAEDSEGTVWLGAGWGAGLVRFKDKRFRTIPAAVGLPRANITGILDDHRGYLWIGSEAGVWRVAKGDLHRCADVGCAAVHATVFGREEGMRAAECTGAFQPNMALDAQGNVWVATLKGVSVFPPPEQAQRPVVTPMIEEIRLDGVPVDGGSRIRLGPMSHDLVIRYTAPSFLEAGRPRLRHRLLGYDPDWVAAGSPALAHYRGLGPGRYQLEIATAAGPTALRLEVVAVPPLWRTPWFIAALVMATAGAVLAFHRMRVARLQLQHRAISRERARIARDLHDGLAQKLTAIGLLTDRVRQEAPDQHASQRLGQMREIVGAAHAELRGAIWDMRDSGEADKRLEVLIQQVIADQVITPPTAIQLHTGGQSVPVRGLLAHEVPLVVKEALTNALRHAEARTIEVGILSDEEGLHVWVRDDGKGFSTDAARSGGAFGLMGMHERARRISGTLTTHSERGRGSEVSLFVPTDSRSQEQT